MAAMAATPTTRSTDMSEQPATPVQAPATVVNIQQPVQTRGPNHVLHGLLSIFTGGLWLPVWIIVAMRNKRHII